MNKHALNENAGFIKTEKILVSKVSTHLEKKGWTVHQEFKIRGRQADILATKNGQLLAVEVKGSSGDTIQGIEQALHQKNAVNYSCLAIPKDRASNAIINSCRNFGIGLLLVNDTIKEVIAPAKGNALPSVQRLVFGQKKKSQKPISSRNYLESLFRSRAQILILKLLFLNSSREFHTNEIARRVEVAPSTITKEMPYLQKIGLVSRRPQGTLVLYKINKKCIIFDEVKRIFLKFETLDEILRKGLSDKDIKYALIYGSFAKGTESETSDIDLLVIGEIDEAAMIKSVSRVERASGRQINFVLWNEKDFAERVRKNIPLIKEIAKTTVMMVIGDKDEFKRTIEKEPS